MQTHRLIAVPIPLGDIWAVPEWENLGGAARRTVKLALGSVARPWQAGEWQRAEGYSSAGRRAKVTVAREEGTIRDLWTGFTTTWALGHPGWQSRSSKVVAQTPRHGLGLKKFTGTDLDIWTHVHGHEICFLLGQVQAVCGMCLPASRLVYQSKILTTGPLAWLDRSVSG